MTENGGNGEQRRRAVGGPGEKLGRVVGAHRGRPDVHRAVEEHDLDALVPEGRQMGRDGAHGPPPGDADERTRPSPAMNCAAALGDGVEHEPLVGLALVGDDHRLLEVPLPLEPAFERGQARRARHDLDAHDPRFARFRQQAARLPARQAEVLGEVRHGHAEVVVALGDLDHQGFALLARHRAELDVTIRRFQAHAGGFSLCRAASRRDRGARSSVASR